MGIYKAALKFLNTDFIFLVKVISDNPTNNFDKSKAIKAIEDNIENFDTFLTKVKAICKPKKYDALPYLEHYKAQFHISTY